VAKEAGKRLSKEKINMILSNVHRGHDANYGITWDSFKMEIYD
jgi:hypothetical protein